MNEAPPVLAMSEAQLDELAQLLDSDLTPEDCMDLSMLQGYLTALLLGPEESDPQRWLSPVWGEDEDAKHFIARAEANRVTELVVELYNEVNQQLEEAPEDYEPILYLDEKDDLQIARPWCMGFMLGAALNEEQWQPLLDDEEVGPVLLPVVLCADEDARAEMAQNGKDPAVFEDEVANSLPEIVTIIKAWWAARQQVKPRAKGRRR